jgi:hypothetical protein
VLAVGLAAGPVHAHGFGQRYDLPVPLPLWLGAAAAAVVVSFVAIGLAAGRRRGEDDYPRLNLLRRRPHRLIADRRTLEVARLVSVALLVLVVAAGFAGDQMPTRNLAPTWVWVIWWVGFAYVSALVGNLWAVVNPWAAIFRWGERAMPPSPGRLRYPRALGMWPAVVLFGAFAWTELVYDGRSIPARLSLMATVYSLITWAGMLAFGRAVWLRNGDPFAGAFGILARFAPTEIRVTNPALCRRCATGCGRSGACVNCGECFDRAAPAEREWNLRPFGSGLLRGSDVSVSMVGFVVLLLSSVTFDGFTATPAWAALEDALYKALAPLGDARLTVIGTLGLVAFPLGFGLVYRLVIGLVARTGGGVRAGVLARLFVLSLVPIAIGYHLAHYFTYFLIQGQLIIRLASDPFGLGWNLFGTGRYRPDIGIVGARFAWYTAVVAIVAGHIAAVCIAHWIALREYPSRRQAVRSQFPLLVLMVGYTVLSLWIIAQPIVETSPKG